MDFHSSSKLLSIEQDHAAFRWFVLRMHPDCSVHKSATRSTIKRKERKQNGSTHEAAWPWVCISTSYATATTILRENNDE